jgi:hypothetical protein
MKRERQLIKNFMQLHSLKVGECDTMLEAYNQTENVWIEETGKRFYKNYQSFLSARTYYVKSRRNYHVSNIKIHRVGY